MGSILDDLINGEKLPDNPTAFEKNLNAFKKTPERLFEYLKKFTLDDICRIYAKKDMPPDYLMLIIRSIKTSGIKEDQDKCEDII